MNEKALFFRLGIVVKLPMIFRLLTTRQLYDMRIEG